MIVLATHIWVWWISNPEDLSNIGRKVIGEATTNKIIYVSSISIWEVALLVTKDRLRFTMDVRIVKSEALPFLNFVPVDNVIALRSIYLPDPLHSDPADRIIIATALTMGAVLVTKDEKILNYPHVKTLW